MSGRTLEGVLARHWEIDVDNGGDQTEFVCDCGATFAVAGDDVDAKHHAHVADEVRAWLAEQLEGEALREAVASSVYLSGGTCDDYLEDERCNHVDHWPEDERDLYRALGWRSFEERHKGIEQRRREKRAAAALNTVRDHLVGGAAEEGMQG